MRQCMRVVQAITYDAQARSSAPTVSESTGHCWKSWPRSEDECTAHCYLDNCCWEEARSRLGSSTSTACTGMLSGAASSSVCLAPWLPGTQQATQEVGYCGTMPNPAHVHASHEQDAHLHALAVAALHWTNTARPVPPAGQVVGEQGANLHRSLARPPVGPQISSCYSMLQCSWHRWRPATSSCCGVQRCAHATPGTPSACAQDRAWDDGKEVCAHAGQPADTEWAVVASDNTGCSAR